MFDRLLEEALHKPAPYERTDDLFWRDPHISTQLLKAHLDESNPLASRSTEFIEQSVAWIESCASPITHPRILDLGCGPGLYATRLARCGYSVTGIDVSPASLAYAKSCSEAEGLNIEYIEGDYLGAELGGPYDAALMAYCDYGALSPDERHGLLDTLHRALRPEGVLILDVFADAHYENAFNRSRWEASSNGAFWRPDAYICLEQQILYPPNVILDRYLVLSTAETKSYNVWTTCFDTASLQDEAVAAGFDAVSFAADLTGVPPAEASKTLAAVLQKQETR